MWLPSEGGETRYARAWRQACGSSSPIFDTRLPSGSHNQNIHLLHHNLRPSFIRALWIPQRSCPERTLCLPIYTQPVIYQYHRLARPRPFQKRALPHASCSEPCGVSPQFPVAYLPIPLFLPARMEMSQYSVYTSSRAGRRGRRQPLGSL